MGKVPLDKKDTLFFLSAPPLPFFTLSRENIEKEVKTVTQLADTLAGSGPSCLVGHFSVPSEGCKATSFYSQLTRTGCWVGLSFPTKWS